MATLYDLYLILRQPIQLIHQLIKLPVNSVDLAPEAVFSWSVWAVASYFYES